MSLRDGVTKAKVNQVIKGISDKLEKKYGEKVLQKMSEKEHMSVEVRSSGRAELDEALGGGFANGKIIEIYSEEGVGKTGLVLEHVAVVQKMGGTVGYIDAEHALNTEYAKRLGVDVDELILSQPSDGEQGFNTARMLIGSGVVDLIIVDSVEGMIPKAIIEGETGESKMGAHARLMSQGLKQMVAILNNSGCTVIFINQLRETINSYGGGKKPTGGNSLKFYATQRLELKKVQLIKEGEQVVGFKQKIKVIKNKIAPPYKEADFDIHYEFGLDSFGSFVADLLFEEIITKKGSWYHYDGSNLANGIKAFRSFLDDNPETREVLENDLKKKRGY